MIYNTLFYKLSIYIFYLLSSSIHIRSLLLFHLSVWYHPILTISIFGNNSRIWSSGTRWSYPKARTSGCSCRMGTNMSSSSPKITPDWSNAFATFINRVSSVSWGIFPFNLSTLVSLAITMVICSASFSASER